MNDYLEIDPAELRKHLGRLKDSVEDPVDVGFLVSTRDREMKNHGAGNSDTMVIS